MDTQNSAVQESGEVKTPVSTPPVEEQTTHSEVINEVPETAEKPDKTPDAPIEEPKESPNEAQDEKSEQGRAFAEMRHEIKKLKEQVEEKKARQVSFDQIRQVAPTPQYQQVDPNQFVDATGAFNKPAYDYAARQAAAHNQQVARQVAAETVEYKLDEYRARQKYPALNTNARFERAVAAEYQTRLLETIGDPTTPQPSIEKIAEEYAPYFAVDQKTVIKEATQKAKQQLTEKEQASLSAAGRSQQSVPNDAELNVLRRKSRYGDNKAIAERLKRLR
jgi:hypothetical protein